MIVRGTIKKDDTREIYRSAVFPTSSFAYAHDLKPELAKKLTDCFFSFRFTPEMTKEFNGDDRFLPITLPEGLGDRARRRREVGHALLQQVRLRRRGEARGGCRRQEEGAARAGQGSLIGKQPHLMSALPNEASGTCRTLIIRNLVKEYRAGQPVLRDISLTIDEPGTVAIIGPSGTGKSTLIRCINRLVEPTAGRDPPQWRGSSSQLDGDALRCAPAPPRHDLPGIQPGRAAERDRRTCSPGGSAMSRLIAAAATWRFPPEDIAHAFALLRPRRARRFHNQPRRCSSPAASASVSASPALVMQRT